LLLFERDTKVLGNPAAPKRMCEWGSFKFLLLIWKSSIWNTKDLGVPQPSTLTINNSGTAWQLDPPFSHCIQYAEIFQYLSNQWKIFELTPFCFFSLIFGIIILRRIYTGNPRPVEQE
jgi:hypothetical protein